jgi:hypothetical protein
MKHSYWPDIRVSRAMLSVANTFPRRVMLAADPSTARGLEQRMRRHVTLAGFLRGFFFVLFCAAAYSAVPQHTRDADDAARHTRLATSAVLPHPIISTRAPTGKFVSFSHHTCEADTNNALVPSTVRALYEARPALDRAKLGCELHSTTAIPPPKA